MSKQEYQEVSSIDRLPENPVVSVALLVYNHEKYIAQALERIISQKTAFPIEIIAAEDCSVDRSREILMDFQRQYPHLMRILVSPANVGMHANADRLLMACRGKYIATCEGDDYWIDDHKLEKQVQIMEQEKDCMVCSHDMNVLQPDGTIELSLRDPARTVFDLEEALDEFVVPTASLLIRRSALPERYPKWTYSLPGLSGYMVYQALSQKGYMRFIPEVMAIYRRHPGGIHSHLGGLRQLENAIRGREILLKEMFPRSPSLQRAIRRFAANVFLNHMMDRSYGEARAVSRRYLWKSAWHRPKDLYFCLSAYFPFLFDLALRPKLERLKATAATDPVRSK